MWVGPWVLWQAQLGLSISLPTQPQQVNSPWTRWLLSPYSSGHPMRCPENKSHNILFWVTTTKVLVTCSLFLCFVFINDLRFCEMFWHHKLYLMPFSFQFLHCIDSTSTISLATTHSSILYPYVYSSMHLCIYLSTHPSPFFCYYPISVLYNLMLKWLQDLVNWFSWNA